MRCLGDQPLAKLRTIYVVGKAITVLMRQIHHRRSALRQDEDPVRRLNAIKRSTRSHYVGNDILNTARVQQRRDCTRRLTPSTAAGIAVTPTVDAGGRLRWRLPRWRFINENRVTGRLVCSSTTRSQRWLDWSQYFDGQFTFTPPNCPVLPQFMKPQPWRALEWNAEPPSRDENDVG